MFSIQKSFGARLALISGSVFICLIAGAYFYSSSAIENQEMLRLTQSLSTEAHFIGHLLSSEMLMPQNQNKLLDLVDELSKDSSSRLTIILPNGTVIADSDVAREKIHLMDNHSSRSEVRAAMEGRQGTRAHYSQTLKKKMFYLAVPYFKEGRVTAIIRIAIPINDVEKNFSTIGQPLLISTLTGIVLSILFSFLLSRSVSKRIRVLTSAAYRYMQGNLETKIPLGSQDELEALARAMNQMAATIQLRFSDLEKERSKFAAVLSHMTEAVIAVNRKHEIVIFNLSAERIFGISRDRALGRPLIEVIRNQKLDEMMVTAVKEHGLVAEDIEWIQNETKILRVHAIGIAHVEDEIAGILVITEITEIRRLENMRKEFVANVSHELKTPLTSILGFVETLLAGALKEPQHAEKFLRNIEEDALRLKSLINDLLDLSRIESHQSPLNIEELNLSEEIEKAIHSFRDRFKSKGIHLENLLERSEMKVRADALHLHQILVNLIDNAIKFNQPEGNIQISAESSDQGVKIWVKDSGIGIPAQDVPRIFERFFRVDKARSREMGGTGLGLAIVKHIVEAHGGSVFCESELGIGSKFVFTLPQ